MADVTMKDLQSLQGFVNKKIADLEKRIADLDKQLAEKVKDLEKRDQTVSDSANEVKEWLKGKIAAVDAKVDELAKRVKQLSDRP